MDREDERNMNNGTTIIHDLRHYAFIVAVNCWVIKLHFLMVGCLLVVRKSSDLFIMYELSDFVRRLSAAHRTHDCGTVGGEGTIYEGESVSQRKKRIARTDNNRL